MTPSEIAIIVVTLVAPLIAVLVEFALNRFRRG